MNFNELKNPIVFVEEPFDSEEFTQIVKETSLAVCDFIVKIFDYDPDTGDLSKFIELVRKRIFGIFDYEHYGKRTEKSLFGMEQIIR